MPSSKPDRSLRSLFGDTRGAILVIFIAGGALLALSVFHLTELGKVAVQRANAQDAADVAALNAAIYQARGMNVLVYLNLLMAVVMACLIAWRILLMLLGVVVMITAIACAVFPPFGCTATANLAHKLAKGIEKDRKFSERIAKICAAVNVMEKIVATVIPPYAWVRASGDILSNRQYNLNWGIAISPGVAPRMGTTVAGALKQNGPALFKEKFADCFGSPYNGRHRQPRARRGETPPPGPEPVPARAPSAPKPLASWNDMAQRRMGFWFSLPVQEDRLGKLCGQASKFMDPLITWGGSFPEIAKYKTAFISSFPALFCAPQSSSGGAENEEGNGAMAILKKEVELSCKKAEEGFDKKTDEQKKADKYAKNGKFDSERCKVESRRAATDKYQKGADARAALDEVLKCVKPAKVWELTRNGNPLMYSFSWASVRTPAPGGLFFASSEMYFSCNGGWLEACDPNAMWQPRWAARNVNVASWADLFGEAAATAFSGTIANGLQKLAGNAASKIPFVGNVIASNLKHSQLTNGVDWTSETKADVWIGKNGLQESLRALANWPLQALDGDGQTRQVEGQGRQVNDPNGQYRDFYYH